MPDVNGHIEHLADNDADELGLWMRTLLPVEPAERASDGPRLIGLDECHVDARPPVSGCVVRLEKEHAVVAMDVGLDNEDFGQPRRIDGHRSDPPASESSRRKRYWP